MFVEKSFESIHIYRKKFGVRGGERAGFAHEKVLYRF